jgi:hypothetical protein
MRQLKCSLAGLMCCALMSLCVYSLPTQSKLSKAIYNPRWPLPIKLVSLQFPRDYTESSPPPPGVWPPQFDQEGAPDAEEFATKAAEIRQAAILEMQEEHRVLLEQHQQQQDQHVDNLAQVRYNCNKSPQCLDPFSTALSLFYHPCAHIKKISSCVHRQAPKLLHVELQHMHYNAIQMLPEVNFQSFLQN